MNVLIIMNAFIVPLVMQEIHAICIVMNADSNQIGMIVVGNLIKIIIYSKNWDVIVIKQIINAFQRLV